VTKAQREQLAALIDHAKAQGIGVFEGHGGAGKDAWAVKFAFRRENPVDGARKALNGAGLDQDPGWIK
jgi:hypothetical protein